MHRGRTLYLYGAIAVCILAVSFSFQWSRSASRQAFAGESSLRNLLEGGYAAGAEAELSELFEKRRRVIGEQILRVQASAMQTRLEELFGKGETDRK